MGDYLHYGIPNQEWTDLVKSTPLTSTTLDSQQTVEDLQHQTNVSRETASSQFMTSGLADEVHWDDVEIPTRDGQVIPARIYRAKQNVETPLPVYLYFHGGGFLFGTISSEDASCARIVSLLPIIIVHVCYRHTPHFQHPTQVHDAWDAFSWVRANMIDFGGDPHRLVVGGVSAGATLAASIVLRENRLSPGKGRVCGQVLCIPWLCHPEAVSGNSSYKQNHDAPLLPRSKVDLFTSLLAAEDKLDTSIFAGNAEDADLVGMPKTVMLVCGLDVLRDEGLLYGERLEKNGYVLFLDGFQGC